VDVVLSIYLTPRQTTTIVDESDTDIFTVSHNPRLWWTVDVITKTGNYARRIECISNKFNILANSSRLIQTEFDLAYE